MAQTGASERACVHCGTPVPHGMEGDYCCRGCEYVARLIREEGLEQFYSLRDGNLPPVSPAALRPGDHAWLAELVKKTEGEGAAAEKPRALVLDLKGVSCVGCVWLLEKLFTRAAIPAELRVHPQRGQMEVHWREPAAADALPGYFEEIRQYGYTVAPGGSVERETERLGGRIGFCAALAMNTMLFTLPTYLGMDPDFAFADLFVLLTVVFGSLAFFVGGGWFIARAWRESRAGVLSIDLPIALGVSAAYVGSMVGFFLGLEAFLYFDFVAIFVFLMLVGRWVHERALERNRNRVRANDPALTEYEAASGEAVGARAIEAGMQLVVHPGQIVPVTGTLGGEAVVSLESINGEPEPRVFHRGARVPSGAALVSSQPVGITAVEGWADSLLARLLQSRPDARRNLLLEKVLTGYIVVVVVLAVLGWAGWGLLGGDWIQAAQVFLSIMVVSCPCSLGVAYPLINDLAAALLRKRGVYVREASVWSRLPQVGTIVFDKTGTLTLETLDFLNEKTLDALSTEALAALRTLVDTSLHPVSRTLRESLVARSVPLPGDGGRLSEVPGNGMLLETGAGRRWALGKPGWEAAGAEDGPAGHTGRVVLSCDGRAAATFFFRDRIRDGAATEIAALAARGYGIALLSGDRVEAVTAMARELGLPAEAAHGGLSPDEKRRWIEREARGGVLMVGDGLNDSLAFEAASVRATPLLDRGVLEDRSDFFFTGTDLSGLRWILAVFHRRRTALRQVFIFAVVYNLSAIGVCLAGWMNPLLAAIIMPLSSVFTIAIATHHLRR